jgi:hypothetical protein
MEHAEQARRDRWSRKVKDASRFAFGSVEWQAVMAYNISVKTIGDIPLTDYEKAFVATQSEHNARIRASEQVAIPANYETEYEKDARRSATCAGCGRHKDVGLVVCWSCFKYGEHAFKYSGVDLETWVNARKAREVGA